MGAAVSVATLRGAMPDRPTQSAERGLRCRITWRHGRQFAGELPPERHRMIQLGMLHRHTAGLVELTPGTRDLDGRLHVDRRSRPEHYLPGGASGARGWLRKLLEHASEICDGEYARMRFECGAREEVFVGVSERSEPRGSKDAVAQARWLWIDVDESDRLEVLWEFLAERPCHLLVESAGSGGVHTYWKLDRPLPARVGHREPIEEANLRIVHALGDDVADANCKERSRVLRLAGTVNYKTGRFARIIQADLALPAYNAAQLVGDLADPPQAEAVRIHQAAKPDEDPYKRVTAAIYFPLLAGIAVPPRGGLVRCPAHDDEHPSCSVSATEPVWTCHARPAGGTAYDLASAVLGGPTGRELRGESFKRARAYVVEVLGEVVGRCTQRSPGGRRGARRRKGRRFYAVVTGKGRRELQVEPIDRRVTYHQVKAREVLEIWHKRRRRNNARQSDDQR